MWQIIDCDGVIDSGTEEEMSIQFDKYVDGTDYLDWNGYLKLIEIHNIYK